MREVSHKELMTVWVPHNPSALCVALLWLSPTCKWGSNFIFKDNLVVPNKSTSYIVVAQVESLFFFFTLKQSIFHTCRNH